jgi:DNA (cytosine-5)-methyltransferase 1
MNEQTMHLFAGAGGGLLADLILGKRPIIAVEWDKYACSVLRARAADGWFPDLSVFDGDVRLFDPSEYAGRVDCINAGFPCQDISVAGKQAGVGEETRSGLYREVLRIADVVRPRELYLENVSAIISNGLGTVLSDLSARGYVARWICVRASDVGANHGRDRWWLLARQLGNTEGKQRNGGNDNSRFSVEQGQVCEFRNSGRTQDVGNTKHAGQYAAEITGSTEQGNDSYTQRQEQAEQLARPGKQYEELAYSASIGQQGQREYVGQINTTKDCDRQTDRAFNDCEVREGWWQSEPDVGGMANELADRLDKDRLTNAISHFKMTHYLMECCHEKKTGRDEVLRVLRNGDVTKEIQQAFGRSFSIYETAVLLAELCRPKGEPDKARVFMESAETLKGELRGMWLRKGIASTSHRSGLEEQRTGKYTDSLQELPRFLAYNTKKNRDGSSGENAAPNWWQLEPDIPRVANGVADRVGKLKALGNGQVPLQAAVAYSILEEMFND